MDTIKVVGVTVVKKIFKLFTTNDGVRTVRYKEATKVPNLYEGGKDVETHTGQIFEPNDPRRFRFMNSPKYVNPNIAIELIAKIPPIASKDRVIWCDGGHQDLGHPKVYINLDKPGNHACGYCGLRYYKEGHSH